MLLPLPPLDDPHSMVHTIASHTAGHLSLPCKLLLLRVYHSHASEKVLTETGLKFCYMKNSNVKIILIYSVDTVHVPRVNA